MLTGYNQKKKKEKLHKNAREKYQNLSEEEKTKSVNAYGNLSEKEKTKSVNMVTNNIKIFLKMKNKG